MISLVKETLLSGRRALDMLLENETSLKNLSDAGEALAACLSSGGRAFSCGNGGSMSDAMHFAEELTGRFRSNRAALAATAISDPGHISCVANDFGYDYIFSRYLEAHAKKGDYFLGFSTSGRSPNVIKAAEVARDLGMTVVALTGKKDSPLGKIVDYDICTPSDTSWADRTQELHVKCLHILIEICEKRVFSESGKEAGQ